MGEPEAAQGGTGQVRTGQVGTGQVCTSRFMTVQVRKGQVKTSQAGQVSTGQNGQVLLSPTCLQVGQLDLKFDSSAAKLVNLIVILAQLVSPSVALPAKVVFVLKSISDLSIETKDKS